VAFGLRNSRDIYRAACVAWRQLRPYIHSWSCSFAQLLNGQKVKEDSASKSPARCERGLLILGFSLMPLEPRTEMKFYCQAPLKTAEHISFLEEFEAALKG
jgi:hypothetical protein